MKLSLTSSLLALTLISALSADTGTTAEPLSQTNIRGKQQPISTSDSVDKGWTFDASFLYWNAKVDGYQFAEVSTLEGLNGGIPDHVNASAKQKSLEFNSWDPGFQIGLGYIFSEREQWHSRLSWTRFTNDSHRSLKTDPDSLDTKHLLPSLFPVLTGPIADQATARWDLEFNTLDFELDRSLFVGKWLSLCPRIGLRGAWIDQDFKAKYHSFFTTSATTFTANTSFKADQNFKGVGMKVGSDVEFYLGRCWSILGNLSTSLLWGHHTVKEKTKGLFFPNATIGVPETAKISNAFNALRASLEGQLGLRWQLFYHNEKYRFACSALYTFAYWFRQNGISDQVVIPIANLVPLGVQNSSQTGDLQIQGLNIRFDFDF